MAGLLVSILIVNWNTRDRVMQCLASLPSDVPGLSK
jgi:GT2 family glycosyltransferase